MEPERLTIDFLERNGACKSAFDFVKRNKLEGFPLDRLNEIEGDYSGYVGWLREKLKCQYEYDNHGNLIKRIFPDGRKIQYEYDNHGSLIKKIFPDGFESTWTTEYYDDGQLKRYDGLYIPWFEKESI